jgi:hypothetical protein
LQGTEALQSHPSHPHVHVLVLVAFADVEVWVERVVGVLPVLVADVVGPVPVELPVIGQHSFSIGSANLPELHPLFELCRRRF